VQIILRSEPKPIHQPMRQQELSTHLSAKHHDDETLQFFANVKNILKEYISAAY
jgi:hypothetical protein